MLKTLPSVANISVPSLYKQLLVFLTLAVRGHMLVYLLHRVAHICMERPILKTLQEDVLAGRQVYISKVGTLETTRQAQCTLNMQHGPSFEAHGARTVQNVLILFF